MLFGITAQSVRNRKKKVSNKTYIFEGVESECAIQNGGFHLKCQSCSSSRSGGIRWGISFGTIQWAP